MTAHKDNDDPRRVLHIIVPQREGAIGGSDLHVLDLAASQAVSGWHPLVLAPRASQHYKRLLAEAGVGVQAGSIWHLPALPREARVDVVHAHGYESNYLLAAMRLASRTWRRLPAVVTAHGWIETNLWLRMKSALDRLTARTAHVRIASAGAHAQRMMGRGENHVVHNGVPPPPEPRSNARHEHGGVVVGSVGRLSSEKRVNLFLRAAAKIATERDDLRLLVVGGGDERAALERLSEELGLAHRVTFTGLVDDMEPHYAEMDVLVQASDTEGTPRTVIEAMARRVPVVGTAVGDVAELLDHGNAGMLVPRGDADALAAAIGRILSDRAYAETLGGRARDRFEERYTIEAMTHQVEKCYESAIRLARYTRRTTRPR